MTQKELSYVEDAIMHEDNIIKILEDMVSNLQDKKLIKFIKDECDIHYSLKEDLMDILEEKIND